MIPLLDLQETQTTARIETIVSNPEEKIRYFALGFIPGSSIKLYQKTVLNGPSIYEIGDTKIAIRDHDAQQIYVSLS